MTDARAMPATRPVRKWLESIQKTKGVCKGLAPAIDMPTPRGAGGGKKPKKKSSSGRRRDDDDDDDGDALEMAPLSSKARQPKPKGKK